MIICVKNTILCLNYISQNIALHSHSETYQKPVSCDSFWGLFKMERNDRIMYQARDLTCTLYYLCYIYIIHLGIYYFLILKKALFKNAFEDEFLKETNYIDPWDLPHHFPLSHTFINKHENTHTLQLQWSSSIICANLKKNEKVTSASHQDRVTRLRSIHLPE